MGKTDKLRAAAGGNVAESLGAGVTTGGPPAPPKPSAKSARFQGVAKSNDVAEIEVARIVADPDQPRKEFDDATINSLADSIKTRGLQQPIRVRWSEGLGHWIIISGERRWRAAQRIGLAKLLCVIEKTELGGSDLRIAQLIENIHREDLSPLDLARSFKQLMDEHGWSQVQIAKETGYERSKVVKTLALLELPSEVQEMVETGAMKSSTAYEVSKAPTPEAQVEVARTVIDQDLTGPETIEEVAKVAARAETKGEGRGAKARAKGKAKAGKAKSKAKPDLQYDRIFNRSGVKLTAESKRGFTLQQLLEVLRHAEEMIEAEIGVEERLSSSA